MLKQHFETFEQMNRLIKERCYEIIGLLTPIWSRYNDRMSAAFEGCIDSVYLSKEGVTVVWENQYTGEETYLITKERLFLPDEELIRRETEKLEEKAEKIRLDSLRKQEEQEKKEFETYLFLKAKFKDKEKDN